MMCYNMSMTRTFEKLVDLLLWIWAVSLDWAEQQWDQFASSRDSARMREPIEYPCPGTAEEAQCEPPPPVSGNPEAFMRGNPRPAENPAPAPMVQLPAETVEKLREAFDTWVKSGKDADVVTWGERTCDLFDAATPAAEAENADMKTTLDRIEKLADEWATVKEVNGNGLEVSIVSPVYHLLSRKLRDALRPEHEYDDEGNDITLLYALSDEAEAEPSALDQRLTNLLAVCDAYARGDELTSQQIDRFYTLADMPTVRWLIRTVWGMRAHRDSLQRQLDAARQEDA